MTDRDRKDRDSRRLTGRDAEGDAELEALGEAAVAENERVSAARLATRLEGGPQAVGEDEDELGALASLSTSLSASSGARRAGEAATDRALDAIFGSVGASQAPARVPANAQENTPGDALGDAPGDALGNAPGDALRYSPTGTPTQALPDANTQAELDAPTDDLEAQRALRLAQAVDRMVAGVPERGRPRSEDEASLWETAAGVRASAHARSISAGRMAEILDEALGCPAAPRRRQGPRVLLAMGLVGALAASLVWVAFLYDAPPSPAQEVPTHLTSRSTRDILPGPFPRTQSESERIDIIYHHRLQAFRELELGARQPPPERAQASREAWAVSLATASRAWARGGIP